MIEEVERILAEADEKDRCILRAAWEEFARSGYHNANMDHIAAAAGLGKGTVYRRFHNKQFLFFAVVRSGHRHLSKRMEQAGAKLPFRESLHAKLAVVTEHLEANVGAMRLMMHEQSKTIENFSAAEVQELSNSMWKEQYEFWRRTVEAAVQEGHLPAREETELSMLALMLAGMVRGCYIEFYFCREMAGLKKEMTDRWNNLLMKILFEGVFA
ncbi:MAG: TetR/AcrR family transcriptional regulator [Spirochaetota bacterium]|jgi:AcrR family transcriptional regulator|nr:TetR/AcrR family transcriptional regulator [Spirochaetota bacterium]